MGRSPCCSKVGLKSGPWSTKEDNLLTSYIQEHGEGQWRSLPKNAGLLRCGKSCRLRWMNYLRPGIKRGNIDQDEEDLIVRLHGLLGNRWSLIAGRLPGRTDNEIKNYWNTHLLKKLNDAGIHPKPHKDLPKPPKTKKPIKKKLKHPENPENHVIIPDHPSVVVMTNDKEVSHDHKDNAPLLKTKVYLPKPIRLSSTFSRTSSYDSLVSGTSSSEGGGSEAAEMVAWPPLFEDGVGIGDGADDFLVMLHQHYSESSLYGGGDVNMLEQVYDEYFQLL